MNRKRKSHGKKPNTSKKNKTVDDPLEFEGDDAPFVDDINDLFKMGFVSIEEVDYFDPKKYKEQLEKEDTGEISEEDIEAADRAGTREESALKSGWTVSSVPTPTVKPGTKKPTKKNETASTNVSNEYPLKERSKQAPNPAKKQQKTLEPTPVVVAPEILDSDLPEWRKFDLEPSLLQGLKHAGYDAPMPIQNASLDALFLQNKRDILGSAPTGSGKTLAFGIPLLNHIIKSPVRTCLSGLIVVPTRELALQIEKHLKLVGRFARVKIATVVGGLSQEKQSRQLKHLPDLIIATPGRLNELMEFDQDVRNMITRVKFLVLDEADRMIQVGHFKELDDILSRIIKFNNEDRQVLLFSATLVESRDKDSPFARLCKKLDLNRGAKDLAQLNFAGKPVSLQESYALCASQEDKETVLFGFLRELKKENGRFGRVLLFANSIDTIRRVAHLMALLNIPNISLHAQMQQRQRLNNLDKFKAAQECVMIASDVAARGIDIVGVDHVIHFHMPKGKETYVHRCGRTARANQSGTSLALVAPEERKLADLCGGLISNRPDVIQYTPNQRDCRDFIIPILKLARRIETTEHSMRSARSEINWAQKLADECELVLDEDNDPSYKKRQEQAQINPKALSKDLEMAKIKLNNLLEQFYNQ